MTDVPATAEATFVEARGLVKIYPGVVALGNVDLTLNRGESLGLVGKNGAGKSTLIKILAGVVQPDEGELIVDGKPVHLHVPRDAAALGFAFVHQELADVPNLTVAENVQLGLGYPKRLGLVQRRELRRRTQTVLDRLESDIRPRAPLASLSIAQRRMVMVARALAAEARLVVLDEPTASLTDDEIEHLHAVLRRLRADGVSIVYVSHRLDEIFAITDRVSVMRDGHTVFERPTADVTMRTLVSEITGNAAPPERRRHRKSRADAKEVLRVEGLSVPAVGLQDAGFVVREGDVLGVAGLIGAGRTELMRAVCGADHAATGRVFVRGEEVRIRSPRDAMAAGIVLLPEDRRHQGAVMSFSVRKNMTLPVMDRFRMAPGVPLPNEGRERKAARGLVDRLRIKVADVEAPVRNLSGGNQQKVVLAKWLERGAEVFIFDEPTHGIDVEGKADVYEVMDELADAGKGVIFISSEFTELVGACNRVIVMVEGHIVGELEGEAIIDAALVALCYRHDHEAEGLAPVVG